MKHLIKMDRPAIAEKINYDTMYKLMDEDGSGNISMEEFMKFYDVYDMVKYELHTSTSDTLIKKKEHETNSQ